MSQTITLKVSMPVATVLYTLLEWTLIQKRFAREMLIPRKVIPDLESLYDELAFQLTTGQS